MPTVPDELGTPLFGFDADTEAAHAVTAWLAESKHRGAAVSPADVQALQVLVARVGLAGFAAGAVAGLAIGRQITGQPTRLTATPEGKLAMSFDHAAVRAQLDQARHGLTEPRRVTLALAEGDTAWDPTSTKRVIVGPAQVVYTEWVDGIDVEVRR